MVPQCVSNSQILNISFKVSLTFLNYSIPCLQCGRKMKPLTIFTKYLQVTPSSMCLCLQSSLSMHPMSYVYVSKFYSLFHAPSKCHLNKKDFIVCYNQKYPCPTLNQKAFYQNRSYSVENILSLVTYLHTCLIYSTYVFNAYVQSIFTKCHVQRPCSITNQVLAFRKAVAL